MIKDTNIYSSDPKAIGGGPVGMDIYSDILMSMGDAATWVGDLISVGLLVAAWAALGTWYVQVLGGRQVQLAEQCLDAAVDFAVRIKIARMEQTNFDGQVEEIRISLREFQRVFLRFNYYASPHISEEIPQTLIRCFEMLDTNFRVLKGFGFQEPRPLGDASLEAVGASAQELLRYQSANSIFYGLSRENDPIGVGLAEAERLLKGALRPILNPHVGCLWS